MKSPQEPFPEAARHKKMQHRLSLSREATSMPLQTRPELLLLSVLLQIGWDAFRKEPAFVGSTPSHILQPKCC